MYQYMRLSDGKWSDEDKENKADNATRRKGKIAS
jgi:hypothetical protein